MSDFSNTTCTSYYASKNHCCLLPSRVISAFSSNCGTIIEIAQFIFSCMPSVLACNKIAESKHLGSLELTLTLPAWLSRIRLVVLKYTFFSLSLFQS